MLVLFGRTAMALRVSCRLRRRRARPRVRSPKGFAPAARPSGHPCRHYSVPAGLEWTVDMKRSAFAVSTVRVRMEARQSA